MYNEKKDISIIIPAFNEERRLPVFLDELIPFCSKSNKTYEVIVVDDGSSDRTAVIARSYMPQFPSLKIIQGVSNRGKGYAVKQGMMKAGGEVCVFLDADGSVGPEEIERNLHYITEDGYDIFIGSRVLKDTGSVLQARWYRKAMGRIFSFFVRSLLFNDLEDTQCGFKMFTEEVAKDLFGKSRLEHFGFDMEILYNALQKGYKVKEGPVSWKHIQGSKVNFAADPVKMFLSILQIRKWHSR